MIKMIKKRVLTINFYSAQNKKCYCQEPEPPFFPRPRVGSGAEQESPKKVASPQQRIYWIYNDLNGMLPVVGYTVNDEAGDSHTDAGQHNLRPPVGDDGVQQLFPRQTFFYSFHSAICRLSERTVGMGPGPRFEPGTGDLEAGTLHTNHYTTTHCNITYRYRANMKSTNQPTNQLTNYWETKRHSSM